MMRVPHILSMLGAACAFTLAAGPSALPEATAKPQATSCFWSRDWQGWKASADSTAIYLRVGRDRIYRMDLASACPELRYPDAHLVTTLHTGSICDALDIDLKVAQGQGFATACIVRKLSQLSPEEAKALPKALQP